MNNGELNHNAKALIRQYLLKITLPTGALAGILVAALGWVINDLATGTAYNDAYHNALTLFHRTIVDMTKEASTSAAVADGARKDAEDARNEIFRIREDVKTATIANILDQAIVKLANDPNFLNRLEKEIGNTLDLSSPKLQRWTQQPLVEINNPDIRDTYDQPILWDDGKKIHKLQGLCFLTSISGKFEGSGEFVEVYIGKGDYWHLRGNSHQAGVAATVMCYKLISAR